MSNENPTGKVARDAAQGTEQARKVLVTGGGGYIGSHTVLSLYAAGYQPILVDNWSNSNPVVLDRLETLSGMRPMHYKLDLRDAAGLNEVFTNNEIDSVIHFAGLKAVGESQHMPLEYYDNNVVGTLNLLSAMRGGACSKIVFSSSATVYGDPESVPITEQASLRATNPYGRTKLMIEEILRDLSASDPQWEIAILRYFNPVGAHASGSLGEDPNGEPNNLVPYIAQVAVGKLKQLSVFGDDYNTADGTGVRDYIHVLDLAQAHLSALEVLVPENGCKAYNIGTGRGYSVLEVIKAFELASGQTIPFEIKPRRTGDIATCYADVAYSKKALNWQAKFDLQTMMADHWRWQKQNPKGYSE